MSATNVTTPADFMRRSQNLDVSSFRLVTCESKTAKCFGEHVALNPWAVRLRDPFGIKFGSGALLCPGCQEVGSKLMGPAFVASMASSRAEKFLGHLKHSVASG